MQPTPAPSSAPNSPGHRQPPGDGPSNYPTPPHNVGSAPFSILVGLFEKLQTERKQEKRKKMIDAWFNVRLANTYPEENPQDDFIALAR